MGAPGKPCTCIFDMFLEGCDLHILLLCCLDLPPLSKSTLQSFISHQSSRFSKQSLLLKAVHMQSHSNKYPWELKVKQQHKMPFLTSFPCRLSWRGGWGCVCVCVCVCVCCFCFLALFCFLLTYSIVTFGGHLCNNNSGPWTTGWILNLLTVSLYLFHRPSQ